MECSSPLEVRFLLLPLPFLHLSFKSLFLRSTGNTYFIENISTRDARLFFTQARKVPKEDFENASGSVVRSLPPTPQQRQKKKSLEEVRSSSPGNLSSTTAAATAGGSGRSARSLPPQSKVAGGRRAKAAGKRAPSAKV